VVFTSSLLSKIMDRYPVVIWIGAAILGRVGAEMIFGDPWVVQRLHPSETFSIAAQAIGAAAVMLAGWGFRKWNFKKGKNARSSNV